MKRVGRCLDDLLNKCSLLSQKTAEELKAQPEMNIARIHSIRNERYVVSPARPSRQAEGLARSYTLTSLVPRPSPALKALRVRGYM